MLAVAIYPVIYTLGYSNRMAENLVSLLAENNLLANSTGDCDYLRVAVNSWVIATALARTDYTVNVQEGGQDIPVLLWAQVLPVRCDWQDPSGVVTICNEAQSNVDPCTFWAQHTPPNTSLPSPEFFAELLGVRVEGILAYSQMTENVPVDFGIGVSNFQVTAITDQADAISYTYVKMQNRSMRECFHRPIPHRLMDRMLSLFILMVCMLCLELTGLAVMRGDTARLVLGPLRRMLKIVVKCKLLLSSSLLP